METNIPCPNHQRHSTMTVHDLAAIRRIILDVIDDKFWRFYADETISSEGGAVTLHGFSQETANANRLDFCDAIETKLLERMK